MKTRIWFGVALIIVGLALYSVPLSRSPRIPEHGTYALVGPELHLANNVTWARLELNLETAEMTFEVAFVFTKIQNYYLQLQLPYFVTFSRPGLGPNFLTENETLWEFVTGNHSSGAGGSAVWLDYHPKFNDIGAAGLWPKRVGVYMKVQEFERSRQFGSESFTMILFAKPPRLEARAYGHMVGGGTLLTCRNFTLNVAFDPTGEIGQATFPSPQSIFVSNDFKSATWILNFDISENRAQAVQLSVEYPRDIILRDSLIFVGGVCFATGLSLIVNFFPRDQKATGRSGPTSRRTDSDPRRNTPPITGTGPQP